MRTRLKDVAALAGVSVKTVSNVVNDYAHVRPETRQRVQQAIEALGYRPNLSARSLRGGRSGVIALAVPELDVPYFAELARHIVTIAGRSGLTVLIDQTEGDAEQERLVVSGIRDHLIDGLILNPLALTEEDLATRDDSTPLVLIGERIHGDIADHVVIDNVRAAGDATRHLIALDRRRIGAIGVQREPSGMTGLLRERGYRQALAEAGLEVDETLLRPARRFHRQDGYEAMRMLLALSEPPDAVFCFNDLLALGALRALSEAGVRVPDDVAVIGFDDIDDGRFSTPSLSTISPDKAEIAQLAVDLLKRGLESKAGDGTPNKPTEVFAHYELIARESTLGAAATR